MGCGIEKERRARAESQGRAQVQLPFTTSPSVIAVCIHSLTSHASVPITPPIVVPLSSVFSVVIHFPFFFSLPYSHSLHPPLIALCNTGGEDGHSVRVTLTSVTPCSTCDPLLSVLRFPLNPYNSLRCPYPLPCISFLCVSPYLLCTVELDLPHLSGGTSLLATHVVSIFES